MKNREDLFRYPGDTGTEELIQSTAFGGLNTTANVLNLPYSDAHRLENVDITPGANLVKRKGTRLIGRIDEETRGINFSRVLSTSGLSFVTAKIGTSLLVYGVANDQLVDLVTFQNVWPAASRSGQVEVIATNEPEQRFIMLSRDSVPVHVKVVERVVAVNSTVTSVTAADSRFAYATPGVDFFVYVNNDLQDPDDFEYDDGVLELTAPLVAGDLVTFVYFYWQWWAEAELYSTNRFSQAITRFNIDNSDRALVVPPELQDGAELDSFGMYRIYCALNAPNNGSMFIRFRAPFSNAAYAPSDGSLNFVVDNQAERAVMGTRSLLFGGLATTGDPAVPVDPFLVHLIRIRRLTHNGGNGLRPQNAYVEFTDFTNTTRIQQVSGGVTDLAKEYGALFFDENNWNDPDAVDTAPSNPQFPGSVGGTDAISNAAGIARFPLPVTTDFTDYASHIAFGNAASRGLPDAAIVRIVNTQTSWVGTAGLATNEKYRSGTWFPAYGLGKLADYDQGYFPSSGAIYQGRLALGGFPTAPMDVLVSAVADNGWPGELYNDFTIDPFSLTSANAFDIKLPGSTSERIQAMGVYQGSLFVAGSDSLHRVFSRSLFDLNNFITQFVGSVGALNEYSMVTTQDAGYLLSSTGVYSIVPSDGLDDSYTVVDMSFKISNLFDIDNVQNMRRLSRLGYDSTTKKIYAAIPRGNTGNLTRVFVLFTDLQAWTEYSFLTGTEIVDMTSYRDNDGTERFLLVQRGCEAQEALFLRTEYEYPIDFAQVASGDAQVSVCPRPSQTIPTLPGTVRYEHRVTTTELNGIEDLEVRLGGRVLEFQTEWVKQLNNTVLMLFSPQEGENLVVSYKNPTARFGTNREYGHEVVRKNLAQVYRNENEYDIDDATGALTLSDDGEDRYIVGTLVPTQYRSPVFSYGVLKQYKRFRNWSGLFDQTAFGHVYAESDLGLTERERLSTAIGRAKNVQDVNLSIIYNNERTGSSDQDVFRLSEILFDISQFDYLDGSISERAYANISVPIQGAGYSVQACLWSHDGDVWALSGYQVEGQRKSRKYRTGE